MEPSLENQDKSCRQKNVKPVTAQEIRGVSSCLCQLHQTSMHIGLNYRCTQGDRLRPPTQYGDNSTGVFTDLPPVHLPIAVSVQHLLERYEHHSVATLTDELMSVSALYQTWTAERPRSPGRASPATFPRCVNIQHHIFLAVTLIEKTSVGTNGLVLSIVSNSSSVYIAQRVFDT